MPILYFVFGFLLCLTLAFWFLVRSRFSRTESLASVREQSLLASRAAVAAVFDSFHVKLDFTEQSLDILDRIIDTGWSANVNVSSSDNTELTDGMYLLGAYLGETIIRCNKAEWRSELRKHPYPFVLIDRRVPASPFDMIKAKFESPFAMNMTHTYHKLIAATAKAPVASDLRETEHPE